MFNKIFITLKIFFNIFIKNNYLKKKSSYSMNGEDLIVYEFFKNKIKGFYVDVGSYHPLRMNNTYLLYRNNWSGINIDPSKFSIKLFNFLRPNDFNISCLASDKNRKLDFFYKKDHYPLNSTVKSSIKKFSKGSIKKTKINSFTLNKIISKTRFKNKRIDFLDIDVEGAELSVLKGLSFKKYNPRLICIEIHQKNIKKNKVYKFLRKKNYTLIWNRSFSFLFKNKDKN